MLNYIVSNCRATICFWWFWTSFYLIMEATVITCFLRQYFQWGWNMYVFTHIVCVSFADGFTGALIPRSNIIEWRWDETDIRYSDVEYLYCSAQPSVSSYIVLNYEISLFLFFNNSIKLLIYAVLVVASCLLLSDKKQWNTACHGHGFVDEFIYFCVNPLKFSNIIPSIDTDIFPSEYYDCIWLEKLAITLYE